MQLEQRRVRPQNRFDDMYRDTEARQNHFAGLAKRFRSAEGNIQAVLHGAGRSCSASPTRKGKSNTCSSEKRARASQYDETEDRTFIPHLYAHKYGSESEEQLPINERLSRYQAARKLRLEMLRAQRESEETRGMGSIPQLISNSQARDRALRARSASPLPCSRGGRTASNVFERLSRDGTARVARQKAAKYQDPECTLTSGLSTRSTRSASPLPWLRSASPKKKPLIAVRFQEHENVQRARRKRLVKRIEDERAAQYTFMPKVLESKRSYHDGSGSSMAKTTQRSSSSQHQRQHHSPSCKTTGEVEFDRCTFKPRIVSRKSECVPKGSVVERLLFEGQEAKEKLERLRRIREEQEMRPCTFKPTIPRYESPHRRSSPSTPRVMVVRSPVSRTHPCQHVHHHHHSSPTISAGPIRGNHSSVVPSSPPRYHHQQQHHHRHQPQSEEQAVTTSALRKVRDTIEGRASLSPPSGSLVVTKLQVSLERPTVSARREDLHYYDEQRDQRDRRSHSVDDRYRHRGVEGRGGARRSLSSPRGRSLSPCSRDRSSPVGQSGSISPSPQLYEQQDEGCRTRKRALPPPPGPPPSYDRSDSPPRTPPRSPPKSSRVRRNCQEEEYDDEEEEEEEDVDQDEEDEFYEDEYEEEEGEGQEQEGQNLPSGRGGWRSRASRNVKGNRSWSRRQQQQSTQIESEEEEEEAYYQNLQEQKQQQQQEEQYYNQEQTQQYYQHQEDGDEGQYGEEAISSGMGGDEAWRETARDGEREEAAQAFLPRDSFDDGDDTLPSIFSRPQDQEEGWEEDTVLAPPSGTRASLAPRPLDSAKPTFTAFAGQTSMYESGCAEEGEEAQGTSPTAVPLKDSSTRDGDENNTTPSGSIFTDAADRVEEELSATQSSNKLDLSKPANSNSSNSSSMGLIQPSESQQLLSPDRALGSKAANHSLPPSPSFGAGYSVPLPRSSSQYNSRPPQRKWEEEEEEEEGEQQQQQVTPPAEAVQEQFLPHDSWDGTSARYPASSTGNSTMISSISQAGFTTTSDMPSTLYGSQSSIPDPNTISSPPASSSSSSPPASSSSSYFSRSLPASALSSYSSSLPASSSSSSATTTTTSTTSTSAPSSSTSVPSSFSSMDPPPSLASMATLMQQSKQQQQQQRHSDSLQTASSTTTTFPFSASSPSSSSSSSPDSPRPSKRLFTRPSRQSLMFQRQQREGQERLEAAVHETLPTISTLSSSTAPPPPTSYYQTGPFGQSSPAVPVPATGWQYSQSQVATSPSQHLASPTPTFFPAAAATLAKSVRFSQHRHENGVKVKAPRPEGVSEEVWRMLDTMELPAGNEPQHASTAVMRLFDTVQDSGATVPTPQGPSVGVSKSIRQPFETVQPPSSSPPPPPSQDATFLPGSAVQPTVASSNAVSSGPPVSQTIMRLFDTVHPPPSSPAPSPSSSEPLGGAPQQPVPMDVMGLFDTRRQPPSSFLASSPSSAPISRPSPAPNTLSGLFDTIQQSSSSSSFSPSSSLSASKAFIMPATVQQGPIPHVTPYAMHLLDTAQPPSTQSLSFPYLATEQHHRQEAASTAAMHLLDTVQPAPTQTTDLSSSLTTISTDAMRLLDTAQPPSQTVNSSSFAHCPASTSAMRLLDTAQPQQASQTAMGLFDTVQPQASPMMTSTSSTTTPAPTADVSRTIMGLFDTVQSTSNTPCPATPATSTTGPMLPRQVPRTIMGLFDTVHPPANPIASSSPSSTATSTMREEDEGSSRAQTYSNTVKGISQIPPFPSQTVTFLPSSTSSASSFGPSVSLRETQRPMEPVFLSSPPPPPPLSPLLPSLHKKRKHNAARI
ncbi:Hypothetical protein NocV09_00702870 [Nannochloropsis oceanica]